MGRLRRPEARGAVDTPSSVWHSHGHLAVSTIVDREKRLRRLIEASVAVGSEASLDDVLQKTVEVAARLVAARYAALGVLDRTGSHLDRLITTGIDDTTRARIGDLPSD